MHARRKAQNRGTDLVAVSSFPDAPSALGFPRSTPLPKYYICRPTSQRYHELWQGCA